MSKKESITIITIIILFMLFRIAPVYLSADEKLFIALFEGLTALISLSAVFLLAIQIRNSFDQTDLQIKQEERNQTAIIKLRTTYTKDIVYFSLYNLGLSSAYEVNIQITQISKSTSKNINSIYVLEPRGSDIPDDDQNLNVSKFKNEIIRNGEFITVVIKKRGKPSYEISLTYKDISSDKLLSTKLSFTFD